MGGDMSEASEFDRVMQSMSEGTYQATSSAMETFPVRPSLSLICTLCIVFFNQYLYYVHYLIMLFNDFSLSPLSHSILHCPFPVTQRRTDIVLMSSPLPLSTVSTHPQDLALIMCLPLPPLVMSLGVQE